MRVIILIGFCYEETYTNDLHPLPGILIDLYSVYTYCITNIKYNKLLVITDIYKETSTNLLLKSMLVGIVNVGIQSFLEKIKDHHLIYFGEDEMMEKIKDEVKDANQILVYYSGHSKYNNLTLPNINYAITKVKDQDEDEEIFKEPKHLIRITDFRDLFLKYSAEDAQILFIMDCCSGIGLRLPFQLILPLDIYRLTDFANHKYTGKKVICLSSAMSDETSVASGYGSIFTRSLLSQLKAGIKYLPLILTNIHNDCQTVNSQTATVHANYPSMKSLFPWVFGRKISVTVDNNLHVLNVMR